MKIYGDWKVDENFEEAVESKFKEIMPDVHTHLELTKLGGEFEKINRPPREITLTEAGGMKIFCDTYFLDTFYKLDKVKHD